jgi:hypothetical protein
LPAIVSAISKTRYDADGADISGIITLADVIPDMRAMSSLNLTHNRLGAKGATNITTAVEVRTIYTSDWDRLA